MTDQLPPGMAMPVRAAVFPDGPDSLLLNPDVPERWWRRERIRALLCPQIVVIGLAGAALTVLAGSAVAEGEGPVAALEWGMSMLPLAGYLLLRWRSGAAVLTDHRHGLTHPCRLDRVRGEFFFRSRDFADLGSVGQGVRSLIAEVDELHRSPARAWIGPDLPREVHLLVWRALCCLDRTRAARSLAAEIADDPGSAVGELAAAAREAVTVIDDALDEVMWHVHACLALTRAWEAKLRHGELAARTEGTLAALTDQSRVQRLAQTAEALPQNVFAYITAARDTTDAGAFPWEQHPLPRSRLRFLPSGLNRSPTPGKAWLRLVRRGEGPS
ncbi:hypothetical protein [Amycolatopsis sp. PS_44_ISF1]|uniref:hypothetical protein n=1 Tax=Amycolatopsis sp. PS_44_ISF1 TaxID=2974917 RepID=UPI0028E097F4|nr:hypothetical protein [Amycolatopsis sp. PS_44_ISF1]MDT8916040.1 hypothetical protein [Amycolatopsis sp. PS_44_ISF1]